MPGMVVLMFALLEYQENILNSQFAVASMLDSLLYGSRGDTMGDSGHHCAADCQHFTALFSHANAIQRRGYVQHVRYAGFDHFCSGVCL